MNLLSGKKKRARPRARDAPRRRRDRRRLRRRRAGRARRGGGRRPRAARSRARRPSPPADWFVVREGRGARRPRAVPRDQDDVAPGRGLKLPPREAALLLRSRRHARRPPRGRGGRAPRDARRARARLRRRSRSTTWLAAYRQSNLALWERYGKGEIDRPTLSARRFADPLADARPRRRAWRRESATSYWDAYGRNWPLVEGAEEVLEHASRVGVVGILSNGFRETQRGEDRALRPRPLGARTSCSRRTSAR